MVITWHVDPARPDLQMIVRAVEILRRSGVVAYPTDTLYGLAVDPRSGDAVHRLFALKGRRPQSALPLIAADVAQAELTGTFDAVARRLAAAWWPGPLTLVIPASPAIHRDALAGGATVAVRVPAHAVARELARAHEFPISATSANPSGTPALASAGDVALALPGVDAILDAGPARGGAPSTIVEVGERGPRLIRAGAVPWERVLESLE
ncbi:MAG: threonylcarbamoyl-AMP synthase [Acidobacteria bacterium]|nr:MAG: threonylcarbamoyl-AMP synthase [Acidobacteriota bacterium]